MFMLYAVNFLLFLNVSTKKKKLLNKYAVGANRQRTQDHENLLFIFQYQTRSSTCCYWSLRASAKHKVMTCGNTAFTQ